VHDHASQLVATALRPEPGWSVLDLCAAPGGKTSHIAEMMYNRGRVDACDVDADRLATVTDLCQRLGISIVSTHLITDASPPPAGPYDAVLVDVPCSNTGVLGRRPEVRWRLQPHEFEHLHRLQASLLRQASERVRPGGVMVYSTCSIEPAENQGIIKQFLKEYKSFLQEAEATAIPGQPSDGGYWCRLRRKS
jgi:16S rRNA (cytosine967-C5)-methyltransferase